MRKTRGFSLVEMMVVVMIILVLVTGSISILSVFMRGQGIKQAGRLVGAQFMQARQRSTSEKIVYFLVLDGTRHTMKLYKDTNLSRNLEIGTDEQVGEEHPLTKSVEFETGVAGMMASAPPVYIRFYPDGSLILPVPEITYAPDAPLPTADLILMQPGQTHKVYLDISPAAGKIRKQAYRIN